jgi:heme oxygenase
MTTTIPKINSPEISFLEKLRANTAKAHKNLESLPISSSLLHPTLSTVDYTAYLRLMYDIVAGLEKEILPSITSIIPQPQQLKAVQIEDDLVFTGYGKPKSFKNPFGSKIMSIPKMLGIAYVVEGSTLGGRFILKNVQAALGYDENGGATYFYGYGNKTGSTWKNFLDSLASFAVNHNCEDEIIEGAVFAFEKIFTHLNCLPQL